MMLSKLFLVFQVRYRERLRTIAASLLAASLLFQITAYPSLAQSVVDLGEIQPNTVNNSSSFDTSSWPVDDDTAVSVEWRIPGGSIGSTFDASGTQNAEVSFAAAINWRPASMYFSIKCVVDSITGKCAGDGPKISIKVPVNLDAGGMGEATLLFGTSPPLDTTPPVFTFTGNPETYTDTDQIIFQIVSDEPISEIGILDTSKINVTGAETVRFTRFDFYTYIGVVTPIGSGPIGLFVPENGEVQ